LPLRAAQEDPPQGGTKAAAQARGTEVAAKRRKEKRRGKLIFGAPDASLEGKTRSLKRKGEKKGQGKMNTVSTRNL